MNLAPKDYLLIWAVIVTAVVVPFFFRKRDQPTRLNLDAGNTSAGEAQDAAAQAQLGAKKTSPPPNAQGKPSQARSHQSPNSAKSTTSTAYQPRAQSAPAYQHPPKNTSRSASRAAPPEVVVEKSLNVFFQWNGHAWDAYEALGLPAGSNLEAVRLTYQKMLTQGDQEQLLFFKAAFDAIVRTRPQG